MAKPPRGGGEALLRLAEHVEDLIYRYEFLPERRFAYVSPASERIVGYTPEEHYLDPDLGQKYISSSDLEALQALLVTGTIAGPLEQQWRHRDGHTVWIEQRNVPILDEAGRLVAVEGISRDITHRKQAEAEREVLVAGIAHDLKNPLTVIIGLSRVLQRPGLDAELVRELSVEIQESGDKMVSLLDEMLDVSRLEAGNTLDLQTSEFDLVTLVSQAARMDERVQVQAKPQAINVEADERRISRVVQNLLANALKYSPDGKAVKAVIRAERQQVVLEVVDKGIGISKSDQPHLFERYYRGANVRARVSGTGLGLWGSRLIVHAHGGNIEVTSSEGKGTTVRVSLPRVPSASKKTSAKPVSPA